MPLTELVHYFNKRNRLVCSAEGEDCFQIVDGQAQARFRGNVLTTLFQPVVERASGLVIGHEAHLRVAAGEWVGGRKKYKSQQAGVWFEEVNVWFVLDHYRLEWL